MKLDLRLALALSGLCAVAVLAATVLSVSVVPPVGDRKGRPLVAQGTLLLDPGCSVDCAGQIMFSALKTVAAPEIVPLGGEAARLRKVGDSIGSFALVDSSAFLLAVASGAHLVAVCSNASAEHRAVFVKQTSEILTARDFANLRAVVSHEQRVAFDAIVAKGAFPRSGLTISEAEDPLGTLVDGRADIAFADAFIAPERLNQLRFAWREIDPAALGVHLPGDVLVTSEQTISDAPQLVTSVVEATLDGWDAVFEDQDQAAQSIFRWNSNFDTQSLLRMLKTARAFVSPMGARRGEMETYRFEELADSMRQDGLIDTGFDFSNILQSRFQNQIYRDRMQSILMRPDFNGKPGRGLY